MKTTIRILTCVLMAVAFWLMALGQRETPLENGEIYLSTEHTIVYTNIDGEVYTNSIGHLTEFRDSRGKLAGAVAGLPAHDMREWTNESISFSTGDRFEHFLTLTNCSFVSFHSKDYSSSTVILRVTDSQWRAITNAYSKYVVTERLEFLK